jgi:hypothetical protein
MPPEKRQSDLHSIDAGDLRQAASDSFAALQMAHLRYEHALESVADPGDPTAEAVVAVRQQGREYAEAVTRYSNAAMAWLSFVDTGLEQAGRSTRKSTAGG